MHEYSLSYALLLFIAAGFSSAAAVLLWRRRAVPGALPLCVFFVALFVWSLTYAFYWLSTASAVRLFWLDVTFFGVVLTSPAVFLFTLSYTQREHWITRNVVILLVIPPLLTLILLWTDPLHGWFFGGQRNADSSNILNGGQAFWAYVLYAYGLLLISYGLLLRYYRRQAKPYRQQTTVVLAAFALPWLGNFVGLAEVSPLPDIDLTPLFFTMTGLMLVYALFYKELFDLVPVARDTVMETMREPVFVVDERQRVVDLNLAARRLLDKMRPLSVGGYIGLPVTDFFAEWPQWIVASDEHSEMQLELDGQTQHYERRLTPLSDNHGLPLGRIMVLNNITRRKQALQRELDLKLEKERMRLLATFIRGAGHEFRTPLTVINSSVHLMTRTDDAERRAIRAEQVMRNVQRITHLIDMMITTVDLESRDTLQHEPVNIAAILEDVCHMMVAKYNDQPQLMYEIEPGLPLVLGSADYLRQAFELLLDNAFCFTPDHGKVNLVVWAEMGEVRLQIRDTGPGIPADLLANVFTMFWRQDEAHTTPGFGLGLPITRRIVELHNGHITIDSPPGEGLRVRLRLPVLISEAMPVV